VPSRRPPAAVTSAAISAVAAMAAVALAFTFFARRHALARRRAFVGREQRLAAEADLTRGVDVDYFHHHLLALAELVAHVLDAVVRDFRDVQEAVDPRHDLDERAEVGDAFDAAEVALVELRRRGQLLDHRDGPRRRLAVRRGDVDAAVVLDV